jgi:hypothetical protein
MTSIEGHSLKLAAALGLFTGALVLHGCAGTAPEQPEGAQPQTAIAVKPPEPKRSRDKTPDYASVVTRAEQEVKRAADKGFLWLNTESYLSASREAQKTGNLEEAVKLAQKALDEALLAQKQAADGANIKSDYTYRR